MEERYEDYPKAKELIRLKTELIRRRNPPPCYIKTDLKSFDLTSLGKYRVIPILIGKFDVIYMDPPWQEYANRQIPLQIKDD
jgi:mRNA (2'-O-methyladenosine-N6-)-methyltransferase